MSLSKTYLWDVSEEEVLWRKGDLKILPNGLQQKNPPLIFFKKGPGETFVVKLPQSCTAFFLKSWCVSSLGNVCTSLATTCNWSDPNERRSEAQRNETRWPAAIGVEHTTSESGQQPTRELLWKLVGKKRAARRGDYRLQINSAVTRVTSSKVLVAIR